MQIGILGGTGPAGSALGARFADMGHSVVLGSRSKERADEAKQAVLDTWPGRPLDLSGGDNETAASAELVVMATPWEGAEPTCAALRAQLGGKVLISMANALVRVGGEFQPLIPPRGSVALHVQAAVPDARVVAAYQHLPAKELGALDHEVASDILVCSDDVEALQQVMELSGSIPGCRALHAGSLSNAAAIEALTATLLNLNVRYKTRVAPQFSGLPA
jgi:NADPH-dependent F420 reductase